MSWTDTRYRIEQIVFALEIRVLGNAYLISLLICSIVKAF